MKAEVGGRLLSATSRDVENIVTVVVTKKIMELFLGCLCEALDVRHDLQCTFMSNMQKVIKLNMT